jgi:hypothetical protein
VSDTTISRVVHGLRSAMTVRAVLLRARAVVGARRACATQCS